MFLGREAVNYSRTLSSTYEAGADKSPFLHNVACHTCSLSQFKSLRFYIAAPHMLSYSLDHPGPWSPDSCSHDMLRFHGLLLQMQHVQLVVAPRSTLPDFLYNPNMPQTLHPIVVSTFFSIIPILLGQWKRRWKLR